MEQLCGVYNNIYIPTMISSCELCGSTIDCVIQAKERGGFILQTVNNECSFCKSKLYGIYVLYGSDYERIEDVMFCTNHGIVDILKKEDEI